MLGGPQALPIKPEQWQAYDEEPSFLLTQNFDALRQTDPQGYGKLLDLSMFTNPPVNYYVYKGKEVVVRSPAVPTEMQGKKTIAGMPIGLWEAPQKDSSVMPLAMRMGCAVGCFYQVHHDSIADLAQLEAFLADETGIAQPPANNPRRRAVIFVQFPSALAGDNRRFAKKKHVAAAAASSSSAPVEESVTVLEDNEKIPAVYEWWFGPAPAQKMVEWPPIGRWKSYHPKVCQSLEEAYQKNGDFKSGVPVNVDGVRYMMQHITPDKPFDYFGKPSREPFLEGNQVTVDHTCFNDIDRASNNCFVQFQKDNPQRRRPARRRPDASEIARSAVMTGNPCAICFSEDGQLTGCNRAHVICKGCLRAALMSLAGDTLVVDNLICGCFGKRTRRALIVLAEHADVSFHDSLVSPPKDPIDQADFAAEEARIRRQFDVGTRTIPHNLFKDKVTEWFNKVFMHDVGHLYHPCSHPDCASKMENWMLIEDFEHRYQSQGISVWTCPAGHRNSVLPSEEEINDMNKNLLLHPEYYIQSAAYDRCALRRYRLCPECIGGGMLMLAVHGGECKQWPGYGRGHQHCFCFACTRKWGEGCSHQSLDCQDPGVQQVRITRDGLELGHVDGQEYIQWLQNKVPVPPPTVYPSGREEGMDRQTRMGLTNQNELWQESLKGTS